jgi:hypothetical protein
MSICPGSKSRAQELNNIEKKMFCQEVTFVGVSKVGVITGVIGSIFLLLPVCLYLYTVIIPYQDVPPMAGTLILVFFLGCNILGIIFAGLTKILLKRSTVFGALFISLGLLNFYLLTKMFYFSGLFGLLLYTPSTVTILVGLSLIKQLRILIKR